MYRKYFSLIPKMVIASFVTAFFILTFIFNISNSKPQQYSYLASSLIKGKTYFLEEPGGWHDTACYKDHSYWPLGIFPAIIIVPFEYFYNLFTGKHFPESFIHFIFVSLIFYLIYKIAKKLAYSKGDSLLWAFAFCFASVFIGIAFIPS